MMRKNTTHKITPKSISQSIPTLKTGEEMAPKKSKKKLIIIVCVVLLSAGGIGAWLMMRKNTTHKITPKSISQSIPTLKTGEDILFSPRFNNISSYQRFNNADWYGVESSVIRVDNSGGVAFYTQKLGVPAGVHIQLVTYKNQLWLSSGNGIAVLKNDESGFEWSSFKSTHHLASSQFLYDSVADKLYLGTIEGFYLFNNATRAFDPVPGAGSSAPVNLKDAAFNKDFLAVTGSGPGKLMWVLNRKTGTWTKPFPAIEDQMQDVFSLSGEIFVIGRTQGYESCASQGSVSADSIFRLDSNGNWQPLTAFNKDKSRPEIFIIRRIKDSRITFQSQPCEQSPYRRYSATYDGNTIVLKDEAVVSSNETSNWEDYQEQKSIIADLMKKTKLHPFMRVEAVDSDDNVIFRADDSPNNTSSIESQDIYVAKGAKLQTASKIDIPNAPAYATVIPILCNQGNGRHLAYMFVGNEVETEGGPSGEWETSSLYKVDGNKATEFVKLDNNVAYPSFSCVGGKITWLGASKVQQLDTTTKKISSIGPAISDSLNGLSAYNGQTYALDNGNLWVLAGSPSADQNFPSDLYYFDSQKSSVTKLATIDRVSLLGGSSDYVWLSYRDKNYDKSTIYVYDKNGKQVLSKPFKSPSLVPIGSDNAVVVTDTSGDVFKQYAMTKLSATGATSIVDTKSAAVQELYMAYDIVPGSDRNYVGVYDKQRNLIWMNDDEFGVFTIPVK